MQSPFECTAGLHLDSSGLNNNPCWWRLFRTTMSFEERVARHYAKFPKTLPLETPPAPYRSIDGKSLTPLYALGLELTRVEFFTLLHREPEFQGRAWDASGVLSTKWQKMVDEGAFKPIFHCPIPRHNRDETVLLPFANNRASQLRLVKEHGSKEIVEEATEFLQLEPDFAARIKWHQAPL
ncbi:hypothetical protein C8R44DRAFT_973204 [Mycena epipterygia]|nr:hypothetical protein C8R44DRAFT_973204 [Mycena epipterygia]